MAGKKSSKDKDGQVHLNGAKEASNYQRDSDDAVKSAKMTKERGNSNSR
jgi:hypothetical protein